MYWLLLNTKRRHERISRENKMRNTYSNELDKLLRWAINIEQVQRTSMPFVRTMNEVQELFRCIAVVADGINLEYPFYADTMRKLSNNLFAQNAPNFFSINLACFWQLNLIIQHINKEPINIAFWSNIHPRIQIISKDLYTDGHYASAAERAIKEVETYLKEKFSNIKPDSKPIADASNAIDALLSDTGLFQFCDTSTQSGKNVRKGTKHLFDGCILAFRNPSAHANINFTKREAFEQITLASQLLYILDKDQIN